MEQGTVRCDRVDDTLVVRARLADVVGEESRTLARLSDEYPGCDLVLVCTDAREVPEHAVNAIVAAYSAQLKKNAASSWSPTITSSTCPRQPLDRVVPVVPDEAAALAILAAQKPET
jgi:hypothetical protein